MTLIKKNIIANLAGNIWSAIMSLAFIPIYIHFMGIESYALIGIYIALMAVSVILDMGMSETINREMARLTSHPDKAQESINLVRTMEALIWIIAVFVGLLTFLLAELHCLPLGKPRCIARGNCSASYFADGILHNFSVALQFLL